MYKTKPIHVLHIDDNPSFEIELTHAQILTKLETEWLDSGQVFFHGAKDIHEWKKNIQKLESMTVGSIIAILDGNFHKNNDICCKDSQVLCNTNMPCGNRWNNILKEKFWERITTILYSSDTSSANKKEYTYIFEKDGKWKIIEKITEIIKQEIT